MRSDQCKSFGVECRHVDGIADCSFQQSGADRLRDFDSNAFLRLGGRGAEMRRQNKVRHFSQRRIAGQWFGFENVERRTGDVAIRNGVR